MERVLMHPQPSPRQLRQRRVTLALMLIMLLGMPVLTAWWFAINFHVNSDKLAAALHKADWSGLLPLLIYLIVALTIGPIGSSVRRKARLIVRDAGLEHCSG